MKLLTATCAVLLTAVQANQENCEDVTYGHGQDEFMCIAPAILASDPDGVIMLCDSSGDKAHGMGTNGCRCAGAECIMDDFGDETSRCCMLPMTCADAADSSSMYCDGGPCECLGSSVLDTGAEGSDGPSCVGAVCTLDNDFNDASKSCCKTEDVPETCADGKSQGGLSCQGGSVDATGHPPSCASFPCTTTDFEDDNGNCCQAAATCDMSGSPLYPAREATRSGGTASGGTGTAGSAEDAGNTVIFTCNNKAELSYTFTCESAGTSTKAGDNCPTTCDMSSVSVPNAAQTGTDGGQQRAATSTEQPGTTMEFACANSAATATVNCVGDYAGTVGAGSSTTTFSTGTECPAPADETSCNAASKKFCPAGASTQASTCQTDCSGCTKFTTDGNTCTETVETTCTVVSKKFCPATASAQASTCQADCSGCTDFTTDGNTCVAASAAATCDMSSLAVTNAARTGGTASGTPPAAAGSTEAEGNTVIFTCTNSAATATYTCASGAVGSAVYSLGTSCPLPSPDSGTTSPDSGSPSPDSGSTSPDSGTTSPDSGTTSTSPNSGTPSPSSSGSTSGGASDKNEKKKISTPSSTTPSSSTSTTEMEKEEDADSTLSHGSITTVATATIGLIGVIMGFMMM